jgi:hypothetical protein
MFRTVLLSVVGLAVAAGGPPLYYQAMDYMKKHPDAMPSFFDSKPSAAAAGAPAAKPASSKVASAKAAAEVPSDVKLIVGTPIVDMTQAFDFSITPGWVLARWPRVSTGMGQIQLQGYRVPLVTGTSTSDLAGSLTYFFNPQQQLQRVTFYGTTGDAERFVALLIQRFGFQRKVLNAAGFFIYEVPDSSGTSQSVLQIRSAEVVKQSDPSRRFQISLTMERPNS